MQGHWGEERERKKHRAGGVGGASIVLWLISAHVRPETIFSGQSREHTKTTEQCSLLIFWTSFSLYVSVAADYDVHSLLSAWLWLASNQRPALHCHSPCSHFPDHSRTHYCLFFLDSDPLPLVCCLTSCWLQTNKTWTVFQRSVSTIPFWQTWIENWVFYSSCFLIPFFHSFSYAYSRSQRRPFSSHTFLLLLGDSEAFQGQMGYVIPPASSTSTPRSVPRWASEPPMEGAHEASWLDARSTLRAAVPL